jgi:hypothetical protein
MKVTIEIPDLDTFIKNVVLGDYFSEVHDKDKLWTELCEVTEKQDSSDLGYGEVFYLYEELNPVELFSLIKGAGQFLYNSILEMKSIPEEDDLIEQLEPATQELQGKLDEIGDYTNTSPHLSPLEDDAIKFAYAAGLRDGVTTGLECLGVDSGVWLHSDIGDKFHCARLDVLDVREPRFVIQDKELMKLVSEITGYSMPWID